jgi:hypothetical protein
VRRASHARPYRDAAAQVEQMNRFDYTVGRFMPLMVAITIASLIAIVTLLG